MVISILGATKPSENTGIFRVIMRHNFCNTKLISLFGKVK